MTTYLGYARTGREFQVTEDLNAIGLQTWCGRKLEFIRRGKKRRPEPVESPYLQNYIFAELPAERFLEVRGIKGLAKTLTPLCAPDMLSLARFQSEVEAEYQKAKAIARNQDAICEYKAGQALTVISGNLQDTMLRFREMVERAHDMHPKIRADMELFGQTVSVEIDPLDVKSATG